MYAGEYRFKATLIASAVTFALILGGGAPATAEDATPSSAPEQFAETPAVAAPTSTPAPEQTAGPTETLAPHVDTVPTPVVSETPQDPAPTSGASRSVVGSDIPRLEITLPAAYSLGQLNLSKNKIPVDPASEAHSLLSITDPVNPSNNVVDASLEEIKGRGNFTWLLDKKPYQVKFDTAVPVLGMPKAKTWILLANHADPSLLRNKVALDLASALGIPGSPDARLVDVTINGEFLGHYLLTEKVEVKKNRLDLVNPGGLLLELDNSYGRSEEFHFTTATSGTTLVLKDAVQKVATPLAPELAASYASAQRHLNEFEAALYAPRPDWAKISSMIDVDSFLTYYFALEFSANPDAVTSSVYFWRDGSTDVLHAGPAWDFDIALGLYGSEEYGGNATADYVMNAATLRKGGTAWFQELFRNPEFAARAGALYDEKVRPVLASTLARLDADVASVQASADANFSRWPEVLDRRSVIVGARASSPAWKAEAAFLREWVAQRIAHLDSAYSASKPTIVIAAHSAQIGWQPGVTGGQFAGTTGRGLALESLSLGLAGGGTSGAVQSRGHVQNVGWTPWATGDGAVGTTGRGLRLEAVSFALTARLAADYDLAYRAHIQNIGWMPWVQAGAIAGTTGQGLRIEAVQVRILKKTTPLVGSTLVYSTHMSQLGWALPSADGTASGATGRGLQLEAVQASIASSQYDGTLSARAHVQDIGWTEWGDSPGVAGTEGRGLRMEALQLRLQGELADHYQVRYSVHVDGSWQDWATGGETAGTSGQAKRIEAVRIELVPRG